MESSDLTILTHDIVAFLCGGGLLKLVSLYMKKRKEEREEKKDDAKSISDLSYTFRKNLEERLDKLEKDNEEKEKKILELSTKLAKFETENKILKIQIKELERKQ